MQLLQLGRHIWVIQGGANIGVIAYDGRCLIIDSGMDKDVGRDILDKHRIPFYTDVQAGLLTLTTLKTLIAPFNHIVAGHGEIYTSLAGAMQAIDYTVQRLEAILDHIRTALAHGEPRQATDILSSVANAQGATINALSQYVLYNTTIQSALSTLYARGEILPTFHDNHLVWRRSEKA